MSNDKIIQEWPFLLSPEMVRQKTGLSKGKAYQLFHCEGFPVIRIGKLMYVNRDDLSDYLTKVRLKTGGVV